MALGGLWGHVGPSGVIWGLEPRIAIPLSLNAKVAFFVILRIVFEAPITKYCKLLQQKLADQNPGSEYQSRPLYYNRRDPTQLEASFQELVGGR